MNDLDIDDELPPITYKRGDKSHPLFKQWHKMVLACSDPAHPQYHLFGGATPKITAVHRWYDFANFKADMESTYENRPDVPTAVARRYLVRRNNRAGFNKNNCYWGLKSEAVIFQKKTKLVSVPLGPNGSNRTMTLRELEKYLKEHAGEDYPNGKEYQLKVREWDAATNKMVPVTRIITTIGPVRLTELRRRLQNGRDLLAPVRPYGPEAEEQREHDAFAKLEARRNARMAAASALNMTLSEYNRKYDVNGNPIVIPADRLPGRMP